MTEPRAPAAKSASVATPHHVAEPKHKQSEKPQRASSTRTATAPPTTSHFTPSTALSEVFKSASSDSGKSTSSEVSKSTSSDSGKSTLSEGRKGRKQLPAIPDADSQASMSAAVQNKNNSAMTEGSGYGPALLEYSLMFEFELLQKQRLPGIYVIPSALTPFVWNGVLFIRQGLYQAAVFKFTLSIPETFPDADCPEIRFETPVFHPLVDAQSGRLDVKRGFPKWRRNVNHLWEVLLYMRRIFYRFDTTAPLNQEAADMYDHHIREYKQRAAENVQESRIHLYDSCDSDDPNAIRFTPWEESKHGTVRRAMLKCGAKTRKSDSENLRRNGLSWIKPGTNQIFSQDDASS